ncbi:MAG: fatty acid desaturase [Thermoanaerobaculia bacterium]|nr:fatty acid desaturase [Thermoanaerobaculia bacterium]
MLSASLPTHSGRTWAEILGPYKGSRLSKSLFQLTTTAALFVLAWYLMFRSLEVSYVLALVLALPAAGLLTRLFIIQHDCGHGSFFKSGAANHAVGFAIGVLMLTPYQYWRRTHAIHHATSGDLDRRELGDIDTLTVSEYLALDRWGRIRYRLYRSMFALLVVGPIYQFVIKHRFPLDAPFSWKKEWADVLWTNLAIVAVVAILVHNIGWKAFLMVHLPILMISSGFGIWLFYVQHQFEDTYWRRAPEWDYYRAGIEGSSFLDLHPIMHWFTGNIGYHHIHHLSSRIPNYLLRQCLDENPELHQVTKITLRQSLSCARLRLWDEEERRLVGFRDLRRSTVQT